jgi:hypothetical protein
MRSYEFRKYIDLIKEASELDEKFGTPVEINPEKRGMFAGKTKSELLKQYNHLKASGPHHRGSKEFTKMKELAFAIRAKGGWGRVKEEMVMCPKCQCEPCRCPTEDYQSLGIGMEGKMMEKAPPGMEDMVLKLKKEYPGEPAKAFATAWSIYNKKHGKR